MKIMTCGMRPVRGLDSIVAENRETQQKIKVDLQTATNKQNKKRRSTK